LDKFYGWNVANLTHWEKSWKDEDGQEHFSGWDAYYLGKDGTVKWTAEYFETKELAQEALDKYLASEEVKVDSSNGRTLV
jgi:hypothetical protein